MRACKHCTSTFTCPRSRIVLISDRKLEQPEFLADLRAFTAGLDISPDHWLDYLVDTYRDYRGLVVFNGEEVFLDTEVFETDSIREWLRDWACAPVPEGVRPRLREESRERIRALATILSMRFPFEASMWGVRAANDNQPPVGSE